MKRFILYAALAALPIGGVAQEKGNVLSSSFDCATSPLMLRLMVKPITREQLSG